MSGTSPARSEYRIRLHPVQRAALEKVSAALGLTYNATIGLALIEAAQRRWPMSDAPSAEVERAAAAG